MSQLLETLNAHAISSKRGERERVLDALRQAASVTPYASEKQYISAAVSQLARDYLVAAANEHYKILPEEALKLQRAIKVEVTETSGSRKGTNHNGEGRGPLLAYVKLGSD